MDCPSCGTRNEAGAKFCINCGAAQSRSCDACGHENPSAANFCANCGSALLASTESAAARAAAPVAAAGPVAERRLVSVMFVDLVGSTALAADRDPEETRELLSRYFDMARRTVEGHGGTIEKFIGDAVMAVWGAPTAHEDDAERAVRAALELVSAVTHIDVAGQPLAARAGVLTGAAAVTVGAENQGMVAGDLVNTASRLQSAAPPGTVLVGEATYRAASNAISFEEAGKQLLKGKPSPVPSWRAVAVVARRGGSGRSTTLEPPFVGREEDLQQLKDLFEATRRDRRSRLVTIVGQAGIGKSRLAWEFEKYLDGVVDEAFWHEGRSPAYGEGISYWALAEMVRRRARITEGSEAAEAREKLAAMLEEYVPDAAERRRIEPRLAGLLGLANLPAEGREELFSSWRLLFERIADRSPTILVFLDLHWADQGLLDFIEDLLAWARSSPILVVALARPELLERRPDWGRQVRNATQTNLEPLSADDMRKLLIGLLPGVPGSSLDAVVERAEGIPLYAVETVRMLLDTGAVVPDGDRFAVRGDLTQLAVAETLQALIAARLDANDPADRALLQDAAVLGLSFTLESLAAVNGGDPAQLVVQLERLSRRQLVTQEVDPNSPERGQYRFVQALLREIAYQSLAREDRRRKHLAAARHFEALGEDELAGVLANHYLDAFRSSRPGPEADALASQARISLLAAADRATSLHSHRQAIAYLEQALTVARDELEQAAIHERIAKAGEPAGDLTLGIVNAKEAVNLYRGAGDGVSQLRAATRLGRNLINFQHEAEAAETLERAIEEAEPLGEVPELAAAWAELARARMLDERHADAVAAGDHALAISGASLWAVVEALITKGTSLGVIGRGVESEATLRGAIHLADRNELTPASLRARNNLAGPLFFINPVEAAELAREGYEMGVRLGHRPFTLQFLMLSQQFGWLNGEWDRWTAAVDDALENADPSPFYVAGLLFDRAARQGARGDLAAAHATVNQAIQAVAHLRTAQVTAAPHLSLAWLALMEGQWALTVDEARMAAQNSNFSIEAWALAAVAGAAGNMPEALDDAAAGLEHPSAEGPVADALAITPGALKAARAGDHDTVKGRLSDAHGSLVEAGYLTLAHFIGLAWGLLIHEPDSPSARAAAEAEAFFMERGASQVVATFRQAVVPLPNRPTRVAAERRTEAEPAR